jgi:hypothetical protein
MKAECSTCTQRVCEADPSCCNLSSGQWDSSCTDLVLNNPDVKAACNGACPGTSSCSHNECDAGVPLTDTCSECAKIVCTKDPWCCTADKKWDAICAGEAAGEPKCPACPKT